MKFILAWSSGQQLLLAQYERIPTSWSCVIAFLFTGNSIQFSNKNRTKTLGLGLLRHTDWLTSFHSDDALWDLRDICTFYVCWLNVVFLSNITYGVRTWYHHTWGVFTSSPASCLAEGKFADRPYFNAVKCQDMFTFLWNNSSLKGYEGLYFMSVKIKKSPYHT